MKSRNLFALLFSVAMMLLASSNAHALNLAWSGSGGSGSDPIGNLWQILNNGPGGAATWSIPGNGQGSVPFGPTSPAGSFVRDFHLQFIDLPQDVSIVGNPGAGADITSMRDLTSVETWIRDIESTSAVSYFAPTASQIDKGESFFVNVIFSRALTATEISDLSFRAQWTDSGIIPEPATATLGLLSLAGLLMRRRREA